MKEIIREFGELPYGKWKDDVYNTSDRAQLHFSTKKFWINDPNGLVYNAYRNEYHLFYQYNPHGVRWGNISWGHAVSKDLVHWEELGLAIPCDEKGMKWSGSAVIDKNNTTGLFDETTHPDDRMVFLITNFKEGQKTYIFLSYSTDGGRTVKQYNDGEPVLYIQDPKVVWHQETKKWLLVGTDSNIYYSSNLIDWHLGGELKDVSGKKMSNWECPDLYPIEVEGASGEIKWVYNAAGSWYVVGRLEYDKNSYNFYAETERQKYNGDSHQYQYGNAFFENSADMSVYATQSFFNDKYSRRISCSWLREEHIESKSWCGYQTIVYEQTLKNTKNGYTLCSYPVEEFNKLRREILYNTQNNVVKQGSNILENVNALLCDIETEITLGNNTKEVGFTVRSDGNNYLKVYYDVNNETLVMDKQQSGSAYKAVIGAPMSKLEDNKIKLRIVVDNAVLEVFGNDGETPIASIADPINSDGMSFYVEGDDITVNKMVVYKMQSAWFDL